MESRTTQLDLPACVLGAPRNDRRVATSALLEQLRQEVPQGRVSFGWLAEYLQARSPEVLVLFLALVGILPGISIVVAALLSILALAMISAGTLHALPPVIASRQFSSAHLVRTIERALPWLEWGERYVRPRDPLVGALLRPFAGLAILALSLTMLVPLPFSNVIPSLAIGLIAFACIEADGLLLAVSMGAAFVSLAFSSAVIWAMLDSAQRIWG